MSKQAAAGDPAFLKQQGKRLTTMRDQLLSKGTARNAVERAPKTRDPELSWRAKTDRKVT